jgi:hypothetical protein
LFKVGQPVRINPKAELGAKYYVGCTFAILIKEKVFTGSTTVKYVDSEGFLQISHQDLGTFWYHPDMLTIAKPLQFKRRSNAI